MIDQVSPVAVDGAAIALEMVGLRQQIDRQEVRFSQLAAAYKKTTHWDEEGSNSALDWIRINCRMTSTAAADRIAVGERLAYLAKRAEAMEEGEIGFAHGLVELASKGGRQRVQMQVTSSIETLLGLIGAPGAETDFSLPVSAATVERWACDCNLTRVLMQDSVVIDVGRSERVIKGPRRRALIARDQHCRWPGCERPASWCDGHHFVHWLHGGGGEIENQVLLCTRHHWKVHEGGWQLVKAEDGQIVAVAPTVIFGKPRAPD